MIFRSQTMRQVMDAMIGTCKAWETHAEIRDDMINPDAPLIVQCGDFGYEVASVGGDPDQDGFVIMLKESPVCEWRDGECIDPRGENAVLLSLLTDCAAVLRTIDAEDTAEAENMASLLAAIDRAQEPSRHKGDLL